MRTSHRRVLVLGSGQLQGLLEELKESCQVVCMDENPLDRKAGIRRMQALGGGWDCVLFGEGWQAVGRMDADILGPLVPMGMVSMRGAGYDRVDVDWLTSVHTIYANNPVAVRVPTAEFTLALMLATTKNLLPLDRSVRHREPGEEVETGDDMRGLTIGIVGLGGIGAEVARRLVAFGPRLLYSQRRRNRELEVGGIEYVQELDAMLKECDMVSLHCPLTPATHHLLDARRLALLRGGILINTSRGPVVDEVALVKALKSGHVRKAGLDVFEREPEVEDYLRTSPRVVLSPHRAAFTPHTAERSGRELVANAVAYIRTGRPNTPVNDL